MPFVKLLLVVMSFCVAGVQNVRGVIFHVPGVLQTTDARAIGKSVS